MFKVLKADQRPRKKGRLCEMLSFLPFYNGYVKPFGDMTGIEEVLVSPGGELIPVLEETELLFLGRKGSLEVTGDDFDSELLKKNTCFLARPGENEIKLLHEKPHGLSRMLTLAFRAEADSDIPRLSGPLDIRFRGTRTSLQTIASGSAEESDCLRLSLDAEVSLAQIGKGEKLSLETLPSRRIMIVVLEGLVSAEKNSLNRNDSLMVMGEPLVNLYAHELARLLVIDLPEFISPRQKEEPGEEEEERAEVSVWRLGEEL